MKAQLAFVGPHHVQGNPATVIQLHVKPADAEGLRPGEFYEVVLEETAPEDPATFFPPAEPTAGSSD